ncbi:hypothetical protein C8R46DRAFT_1185891 [Mycena filopes]|nr:hypothetical protein C8R46DRAFT_1185891 [Mycena filopes]
MANPPTSLLLSHRGVEAGLTDPKSHSISHGAVTVAGNQITTAVHVAEKTTSYMALTKPETQYRTAKTSNQEGWFCTPAATEKGGFVQLEIRRARNAPEQISSSTTDSDGDSQQRIQVDLIDSAADPPFIVFKFEFGESGEKGRLILTPEENPGPRKRKRTESEAAKRSRPQAKTPSKTAKASVTPSVGASSSGGGTIVEKLIAAKAEADKLDVELEKRLLALEKSNAAKRQLLRK